MSTKEKNDNTRVQKPQIHSRIKRTIRRRDKDAVILQDYRTQKLREESHKLSIEAYNKQKMDKALRFTGQFFLNAMNLGMPSHLIGVATSDKPWIETIGNPEVLATGNETVNFALDMTSPSKFAKAIAFVPFIKAFKTVGETKKLLTAANYNTISKPIKDLHGMSMFDWYNRHGSLPGEHLSKFKAIMKIAEQGTKGKKGVNAELQDIAAKAKSKTPEGQAALIREKYAKLIEQLKNDSRRGKSLIDWSDIGGNNLLGGMPDELKISPVGFDQTTPFLERYYNNVFKKIAPLLKKLLDSGQLKVSEDGKHWLGLVNGEFIEVNPNRYIISHLPEATRFGNKVNVLPLLTAHIPVHGTKFKNWPYLTQPNNGYKRTLYTIIPDGKEATSNVIEHYKGTGASMPVMTKPGLEPPPPKTGRTGNSNSSGVSSGAPNGRVATPMGVSDALTQGTPINEYNFGPNVDDIKSYWNTLDFEEGAGPLAYNNKNSQNNLV